MTFTPIQDYQFAVTGAASTALAIPELSQLGARGAPQLRVEARGTGMYFEMGSDNTVTASATPIAGKMPMGSTHIEAGAIEVFNMPNSNLFLSAISDNSGSGILFVTVGYGEEE